MWKKKGISTEIKQVQPECQSIDSFIHREQPVLQYAPNLIAVLKEIVEIEKLSLDTEYAYS